MRGELATTRLIAYAAPALPLAVLTLPLYTLMPNHYAANVGLPIAVVGQILLLVRLFDAVTDPIVGVLSDRTAGRFGRRKIWVACGLPLTALAAVMLFRPVPGADAAYLLVWGAALSLGWTIVLVPYNAWGAELSQSYAGRNRVAAFREGVGFVGLLAALTVQAIVGDVGATLAVFALVIAIGLPAACLLPLALVPEPENRSVASIDFGAGLMAMAANRPFVRLIAAYLVNGLANGLPATLFLFYVTERLGSDGATAGLLLVVYVLCGIAGMPLWLYLARRTSKHRAWCIAMLFNSLAFAPALLLGAGDVKLFAIVCVATGLAVGADLVLPASLQADVIDVDTAETGEQRSGLYLAAWMLATKLALALAVGVAFPVLAWAGFDPQAGAHAEFGLLTLALLYAGLPILLKLIAIVLMWRFPLDAAGQTLLRERIDARRGAP